MCVPWQALEQEMQARYRRCEGVCGVGEALVHNQHYAHRDITVRIKGLRDRWTRLQSLAAKRRQLLEDAYESHQVSR